MDYKSFDISQIIQDIIEDLKIIYPKQNINFTPKKLSSFLTVI